MRPSPSFLTLAALLLLAPASRGQSIVRTFPGEAAGSQAGRHFDFVGDIDGDGVPDLVIGYPDDDTLGVDVGKAQLLSGADGSLLWEHFGEDPGDRFGEVIGAAGDVDGDGVDDFMIASPWRRNEHGGGWIFSGADLSVNISYRGLHEGDRFGESLGIIGDFDNDGFSDTLWSAPGRTTVHGQDRGAIYVYSGVDGATIFELWPTNGVGGNGVRLGTYVSWVGDVDNDQVDDFFVATPETDDTNTIIGVACVMSGVDGSILRQVAGTDDGNGTITVQGLSIAGTGDVNGDDHNDFLVSSRTTGQNSRVTLYSGSDGAVLRVYPDALDAATVARVKNTGDMDGDGILDHAIHGIVADALVVYSGADGSVLQTIVWPQAGVDFAADFVASADLDGDGRNELAVGVPLDDAAGVDAGQVAVFSGNPCGAATNYCTGGTHSEGDAAHMATIGSSSLVRNDLRLRATDCPQNKFGIFFYGPNAIQVPFGDGFRCVGGQTFRLLPAINTGMSGVATRAVDLTTPPHANGQIQTGSTWRFQFWYRDPMGPGGTGFNLSDGVSITFCD